MVFEPVVVVHISPKSSGGLEHITYVYIVDIYIYIYIYVHIYCMYVQKKYINIYMTGSYCT